MSHFQDEFHERIFILWCVSKARFVRLHNRFFNLVDSGLNVKVVLGQPSVFALVSLELKYFGIKHSVIDFLH